MIPRWRTIIAALPFFAAALALILTPIWAMRAGGNCASNARGFLFLGVMALLAAELAAIGWLVNKRPIGAFIDNRNRVSLSKLQAGAWTVVVLSALVTAAAFNAVAPGMSAANVSALNVQIPGELLLAMGISATSLVATPSILSLKADQPTPSQTAQEDAATKMNVATSSVKANGTLVTKAKPEEASWGDLVTGDEVGNAGMPDLGKIQQALITLLLLGCYIGYAFNDFSAHTAVIVSLPLLDKSFVWLMGISHASYLAYKAVPHTPTEGVK
jgi:hypothetical protein